PAGVIGATSPKSRRALARPARVSAWFSSCCAAAASPATPRKATLTPSLPFSTLAMSSQVQGVEGRTELIALRAVATGSPAGTISFWTTSLPSPPPPRGETRSPNAYQPPAAAASAAATTPPTSKALFGPREAPTGWVTPGVGGGGGGGGGGADETAPPLRAAST